MSNPTKAVEETAKAAGEIAKTADTALELAGKAGSFVAKVFGDAATQLGGMATDQVKLWRYQRLLSIQDKVNEIHRRRGVVGTTIPVPYKLGLPMLEAASLEDEETLQSMWAKLIANAMDPDHSERVLPAFSEVLKQLSSDEGLIIAAIPEHMKQDNGNRILFQSDLTSDVQEIYTATRKICAWMLSLPLKNPKNVPLYHQNLLRLQILENLDRESIILSDFGAALIRQCTGEGLYGQAPPRTIWTGYSHRGFQ